MSDAPSLGGETPPRVLSSVPTDPHYHPCCLRVGVLFNGAERRDIVAYNQDTNTIKTQLCDELTGIIEPFWRYPEGRQERRRREAWESKHRATDRPESGRKD